MEEDRNKNWTCGCLYKCNDCLECEEKGIDKRDFFATKDDDY